MLRELSVQNLATIEDVQIELEDGFCVWSGETGAGKSLLLSGLGLVLGGKASAELAARDRIAALDELAAATDRGALQVWNARWDARLGGADIA